VSQFSVWVEILSEPPRRIHARTLRGRSTETFGDASMSAHALLGALPKLPQSTSWDGVTNPNMTIPIDNEHGQVNAIYPVPPLGYQVLVKGLRPVIGSDDPAVVTLFAGVCTAFSYGPQASVVAQS
jgi:hypothetical protein